MRNFPIPILLALAVLTMQARADLTATVYPNTLGTNDRPTVTTLNLLGRPAVSISGTLGGTNVALGAETINGTNLWDSVAGAGLAWDENDPRGLMIADEGVGVRQLSGTNFGLGVTGGAGAVVRTLVDTNTVRWNGAGRLAVNSNLFGCGLTLTNGVVVGETNFASGEYAITGTGLIANVAHGLGATPAWVRWVLVCKTNELGYATGDEVDVTGITSTTDGDNTFLGGATVNNVFLIRNENTQSTGVRMLVKTNGVEEYATLARWKSKAYVEAQPCAASTPICLPEVTTITSANDTNTQTVTVSWQPADRATGYLLAVTGTTNFTVLTTNTSVVYNYQWVAGVTNYHCVAPSNSCGLAELSNTNVVEHYASLAAYSLLLASAQWPLTNIISPAGVDLTEAYWGGSFPGDLWTNSSNDSLVYEDTLGMVAGLVNNNLLSASVEMSTAAIEESSATGGVIGSPINAVSYIGIVTNTQPFSTNILQIYWTAAVTSNPGSGGVIDTYNGTELIISVDGGSLLSMSTNFQSSGVHTGMFEVGMTNTAIPVQYQTSAACYYTFTNAYHSIATTLRFEWR